MEIIKTYTETVKSCCTKDIRVQEIKYRNHMVAVRCKVLYCVTMWLSVICYVQVSQPDMTRFVAWKTLELFQLSVVQVKHQSDGQNGRRSCDWSTWSDTQGLRCGWATWSAVTCEGRGLMSGCDDMETSVDWDAAWLTRQRVQRTLLTWKLKSEKLQ